MFIVLFYKWLILKLPLIDTLQLNEIENFKSFNEIKKFKSLVNTLKLNEIKKINHYLPNGLLMIFQFAKTPCVRHDYLVKFHLHKYTTFHV